MSLNILIVGAGMYVCGKGTNSFGTIIPALIELNKKGTDICVYVAATKTATIKEFKNKLNEANSYMGGNLKVEAYPENVDNPKVYLEVAKKLIGKTCAIVCTPDHTHYEITKNLMELNFPCLVVKPLTPTLEEARNLQKIQEEKDLYCVVEFHKRFDKSNLMLKDAFESGRIGDPLYFLVEYSQRKEIPESIFKGWSDKTNIFQYLGVHYVDIIYFVTGARPLNARALGQKNYLLSKGIDTYDSVEVMIEWEMNNGFRFNSVFVTNWIDPMNTTALSDQKIKVVGTKGRFEADQKNRGIMIVDDAKNEQPNPDFCYFYGYEGKKDARGYGIESIQTYIYDLFDIYNGNRSRGSLEAFRPTFLSALISVAVVGAVNQSLGSNGEKVVIEIP